MARFSRRRVRGVVPEPRGSSRVARAHDQHGHGAVFQHVPAHRAEHGAAQRFEPETALVARADQHEVERVFFFPPRLVSRRARRPSRARGPPGKAFRSVQYRRDIKTIDAPFRFLRSRSSRRFQTLTRARSRETPEAAASASSRRRRVCRRRSARAPRRAHAGTPRARLRRPFPRLAPRTGRTRARERGASTLGTRKG